MKHFISVIRLLLIAALSYLFALLPIAAALAIIYLTLEKPQAILSVAIIYGAIISFLLVVFKLAEHPRTKGVTQLIIALVAVAFFIHSCHNYQGEIGECTPGRYVDC
jgi:hypothetical protein